jgi:hypothetical protein
MVVLLVTAVVLLGVLVALDRVVPLVARARRRLPAFGDGAPVPDFATTTVDGTELTRDDLGEGTLVGFFSTGSRACADALPGFVERAAGLPRDRVLAVVRRGEDEVTDFVITLLRVARVVVEPVDGPLSTAFAVRHVPVTCEIDGRGRVSAVSGNPAVRPGGPVSPSRAPRPRQPARAGRTTRP